MRRRLSLMAAALALGSCSQDLTDSGRVLDVSVSVNPIAVRRTEPARVVVTVSNRGTRRITINAELCPGAFVVRNLQGDLVGPTWYCALSASERILAPGEEFEFRDLWQVSRLAAGDYVIRGRVAARGIGVIEGDSVRVTVEN